MHIYCISDLSTGLFKAAEIFLTELTSVDISSISREVSIWPKTFSAEYSVKFQNLRTKGWWRLYRSPVSPNDLNSLSELDTFLSTPLLHSVRSFQVGLGRLWYIAKWNKKVSSPLEIASGSQVL